MRLFEARRCVSLQCVRASDEYVVSSDKWEIDHQTPACKRAPHVLSSSI